MLRRVDALALARVEYVEQALFLAARQLAFLRLQVSGIVLQMAEPNTRSFILLLDDHALLRLHRRQSLLRLHRGGNVGHLALGLTRRELLILILLRWRDRIMMILYRLH